MDAKTHAWIDQEQAWLAETIRRYGWAIQYVGGESCREPGCKCAPTEKSAFAYTIGMFGLAHPELLIVGAGMETSAGVLNDLGDRIRGGEALLPGQLITFENWPHRVIPEVVHNPREILFGANAYYQRPAVYSVPALQLSYDDKKGRFPMGGRLCESGHAARTGHLRCIRGSVAALRLLYEVAGQDRQLG